MAVRHPVSPGPSRRLSFASGRRPAPDVSGPVPEPAKTARRSCAG